MSETLSPPRRVTVVAPNARVDVALPADATVSELVPQLAHLLGMPADDPAVTSGGWLLSRLGRDPFDTARTVGALGLADGELLYLLPRSQRMPPAVFDDIIDAFAGKTDDLPGGWSPAATRRSGLAAALVLVVTAAVLLVVAAPPWSALLTPAAALCLALVTGAAVLSRVVGDSGAGAGAGAGALVHAAVAGAAAFGGDAPGPTRLPGLGLLGAVVCVGVVAVVLAVAVADGVAAFVATAVTSAVLAVALTATLATGARASTSAAVLGAVLVLLWPTLPAAALRLARVRIPSVPGDLEEFRTRTPLTPEAEIERQAVLAAGYLTGLLAGAATLVLGSAAVLAVTGGGWRVALAACLSGGLVLRARTPMRSRGQRLVLLAGGAAGAVVVGLHLTLGAPPGTQVRAAAALVAAAGLLATFALLAPGRAPSPYWGRFYDVVDFLVLAAVFPLAAQVTGLFARARGFGG
ncbi:MAG: type VII secretion integral membrane protein EccD [Actinobacteria bacterium]|nr:type VII secretion integral membrane protein EccD [Actinomycetota bacterium]